MKNEQKFQQAVLDALKAHRNLWETQRSLILILKDENLVEFKTVFQLLNGITLKDGKKIYSFSKSSISMLVACTSMTKKQLEAHTSLYAAYKSTLTAPEKTEVIRIKKTEKEWLKSHRLSIADLIQFYEACMTSAKS